MVTPHFGYWPTVLCPGWDRSDEWPSPKSDAGRHNRCTFDTVHKSAWLIVNMTIMIKSIDMLAWIGQIQNDPGIKSAITRATSPLFGQIHVNSGIQIIFDFIGKFPWNVYYIYGNSNWLLQTQTNSNQLKPDWFILVKLTISHVDLWTDWNQVILTI